jgi:hypothetical protein
MRADQAIMIAVGVLGGYVVYRMLKAPKGVQTTETETMLASQAPLSSSLALQGSPLSLRQGSRYRVRLHLATNLPPFGVNSPNEDIQKGFETMGFGSVVVQKEAPSGWPAESLQNPEPITRWIEGTWMKPSMQLPRPKEIVMMWQTRSLPS